MQLKADVLEAERDAATGVTVEIASVATAVPQYTITQDDAALRAQTFFPHFARLEALYTNTGIDCRYSIEPMEWHLQPHTWEQRTESYQRNALDLLEQVAVQAVAEAGLSLRDIDVIVSNTVTGLAIPSLEARLMNRLAFRPDVERLPMFGLGCGAGVGGLARSARMAQARPGANVLFLTVDLCTLCMRTEDQSLAMFVAAALFGDGAAGVVLRSHAGERRGAPRGRARIGAIGEHFWANTEHIMGWAIKNDGFGVVLSPELPTLMREKLGEALFPFLERAGLTLADFDGFLLHPGGSKILLTAEESLQLPRERLRHSWEVLRKYGNMSSATALFVIKEAFGAGARGRYLLGAFGPGFSAYFVVLDLY
jgi:alkylresorcinol/alkylpyrone synthase